MIGRRRRSRQAQQYSCTVSPERQARLKQQYNRAVMQRWAEETGVAARVLKLIVTMMRDYRATRKHGGS